MKIFPGVHNIIDSEDITTNHIPLSAADYESQFIPEIKIKKSDFLVAPSVKKIYPYQSFDTDKLYFFKNGEPVDASQYLKRDGNKYYFEPIDSYEFTPREFNYSILLNKNGIYRNDVDYNIKVGAYSLDLAEKLVGISKSTVAPINVKINGGSAMFSGFVNSSYRDCDFVFTDDIYIKSIEKNEIEDILEHHTNIWITCDQWEGLFKEDTNKNGAILSEDNNIYSQIWLGNLDYYVDLNFNIDLFPQNEYEYINLFDGKCPILVLKKENKGFIVISKSDILDNIDIKDMLVYEILTKIYLNSYFETGTRTTIIADELIDYYITIKQFNRNHPYINLVRLLYEDGYNINIPYSIVKANIPNDIMFIGLDKLNNICFESNIKVDPKKPDGCISILTPKETIIFYDLKNNILELMEDELKIYYQNKNDKNYIIVEPFKSSSKMMCTNSQSRIEVPDNDTYTIRYSYASKSFELFNIYDAITTSSFIVAEIYTEQSLSNIKLKDIRIIGGGESDNVLNYDMIDTGSIKGRPYRVGSTLIIKLPEQYRKYKDNLMSEINKHVSSADYPILIFE